MALELNAAQVQGIIADVRLAVPKALGVGGHAWTVERDAGNPPEDAVECYVKQQRIGSLTQEAHGLKVRDEWVVTAPQGTDLQIDDTITSVANGDLRFILTDSIASNGYLQWSATPAP